MLDLTVASMLTGLVSVGVGAPVDLVKIRLQMQTQTVLAGKSGLCLFVCDETTIGSEAQKLGLLFFST